MLEAEITKYAVVQDNKGTTVLMGVAEYFGEKVNFKVPYDWQTLDVEWFTKELRERIAQDLELPVYRVDIKESRLLAYMRAQSEWFNQVKSRFEL